MSAVLTIDKSKVKQSFSSAALSYDGLASLQREVGLDLFKLFINGDADHNVAEETIIDIGCGTGFLTQHLVNRKLAKNVIALDIALSMLQYTQSRLKKERDITYICADAEAIPFQQHAVDQIYSNLALQWCQNLLAVFSGFKHVLIPEGQLCFSTFGPATLHELKKAWAEADNFSHVNEFYSVDQIRDFLQQANFKQIDIESRRYQSEYPSVLALMRELKGIGAHNVLAGRNRRITSKTTMQHMIRAYEQYRTGQFIPATYEIIFVKAK